MNGSSDPPPGSSDASTPAESEELHRATTDCGGCGVPDKSVAHREYGRHAGRSVCNFCAAFWNPNADDERVIRAIGFAYNNLKYILLNTTR